MRATYIKQLDNGMADQRLYRLSEPVAFGDIGEGDDPQRTSYVVVSATVAPFSGPETYIFPADSEGEIRSFLEMDGSYRGGLDHNEALTGLGVDVLIDEDDG